MKQQVSDQGNALYVQSIPETKEGTLLAVVVAAIERATPYLRVDGVLALPERLYAVCFDTRHQIIVGFASLEDWDAYRALVGSQAEKGAS